MSTGNSSGPWLARPGGEGGPEEELSEHLQAVARLASDYASKLGYLGLGYNAGLLHDIGKALDHFQAYLQGESERDGYNHSSAGALYADSPLSLPIACHHGGLEARAVVANRLQEDAESERVQRALGNAETFLEGRLAEEEELPSDPARRAFLLRMLHSALIDADWTRVARHQGSFSPPETPPIGALARRMRGSQERITDRSSRINRIRADIRRQCIEAAEGEPGIYTASIPTGGGKTRALMEMALRHAEKWDLSRVIVLAPYVSILQQSAQVYRRIFGDEAVLEHHGSVDLWRASTREYARATSRWDRPIVVSTFVQGLESLMHTSNTRLRKTHRFAESVVILDEIQNLPYQLRDTTIWMIEELARLQATVIASSATQIPMPGTEVIGNPPELYRRMKRVDYNYDRADTGGLAERSPAELWDAAEPCSMVVVNTTGDARRVAEANPEAYHLSTKMTPAHREAVINEIKVRLDSESKDGRRNAQLVTTQIVEAGVDLDFDQVIRLLGPVDNVIQAAGRCNRESRMGSGEVLITRLEDGNAPPGAYEAGICAHEEMVGLHGSMDLNDPRWLEQYYQRMESRVPSAHPRIMAALEELDYSAAHDKYQLINSAKQVDVLVPHPEHGASDELVERIREGPITMRLLREARSYMVSPYIWSVEEMAEEGRVDVIREDLDLRLWTGSYDERLGIG